MADRPICKFTDCCNPACKRGWCSGHYSAWRRHGDPSGIGTMKGEPLRFLQGVVENPPAGCVLWPYAKHPLGYGRLRVGKKMVPAHRLGWEMYHGKEMRDGMHAAHAPGICHEPSCVNPTHIREATPTENHADKHVDGTVTCGENHHAARLCEADVRAIRSDVRVHTKIASDYGIARQTVGDIKSRKRWGWLD